MCIRDRAKAGYFVEDDWMLLGQVEYNHSGLEGVKDYFSVGAQARYYIEQNLSLIHILE